MHAVWRCPLAQQTSPCFAGAGGASAAHRLPFASALPRLRIVARFHLFICCLLSFSLSDLNVHKYLSDLSPVSNLAAGYRGKSKSFLDFFLLLHV